MLKCWMQRIGVVFVHGQDMQGECRSANAFFAGCCCIVKGTYYYFAGLFSTLEKFLCQVLNF